MTLEAIVRNDMNGNYNEALSGLQELRQDPSTDLALVHVLTPYQRLLEAHVVCESGWWNRTYARLVEKFKNRLVAAK